MRFTNPVKATLDTDGGGIITELVLNMRDAYEEWVGEMAQKGVLSWSSGAVSHMVRIDWEDGRIRSWPIGEFSLTPTPAEPRTFVSAKMAPEQTGIPGIRRINTDEEWYLNEMARINLKNTLI